MQKIIIIKGLPASGKTTWAREYQKANPNTKRINKDDLRAMMDLEWSHDNEKHTLMCRDELIELSILNGFDVIVDDTNFAPKHEARIRELALSMAEIYKNTDSKPLEVEVSIKDFTDVSIETCIKRDKERANCVGADVITDMYTKYLKPKPPVIEYNKSLPDCIIADIDGTLAHNTGRGIYEWDRVGEDKKDDQIVDIISRYGEIHIIIVSGRSDRCRPETEKWLADNGIQYNDLFMRKDGDMRKDVLVKKEIYEAEIMGRYNVKFILDDRNQTVQGWRDLGLKCLQVADGNF